jgi:hypothetical protein
MSAASVDAGGGNFGVGDVLSRAWRVFTGDILFFLAVPFIIQVVIYVGAFGGALVLTVAGVAANLGWLVGVGIFLAVVLALSFQMIGQGVLLLGAFQRLRGQPLRIGEALRRVLARFFPLVGLTILWSLALVFTLLACSLILSALAAATGGVMLVLMPAFFVPSTILLVMWAVVVPACIVEGLGPIASMSRSAGLSKGCRWKIFGIMALLALLLVVGFIVQLIVTPVSQVLATIVGTIWFVGWTAYWNCAIIMTYHDLRVAKEGIDTEQIASIFD